MYRIISITTLAIGLALSLAGCSDTTDRDSEPRPKVSITASTIAPEADPDSRSCVDLSTALGEQFIGLLWSPGDTIGVFGTVDRNVPFVNEEKSANLAKTSFSGHPQGMLQYAYFPYSPNAGTDIENLRGNVPATQDATGKLAADYKFGVIENGVIDTSVSFKNMLSLVRLELSVVGSPLEADTLESVAFEVSRGGQPVGISGDFTFSATTGAISPAADAKGGLTATFGGKDAQSFLGFVSMLPTPQKGDDLKVTVTTSNHVASFLVKMRVNFLQGYVYNFPLQLANYASAEYGWIVEDKAPSDEYMTGTFTAATFNVDGLPNILGINSDGPGASGTTLLGQKANAMGWDFFGVSEDFEHNDNLVAALTNYNHGTWRGTITVWNSSKWNRADTDGLNFFWNKSKEITVKNEAWTQFTHEAGDLTHGANECIKKGFRYYLVTMKDGTEIDVYITHMNTSGDGGRNEAQNEQITEVVDYILDHDNGRPIIFMGDTNLRWTRHEILTRLYNRINAVEGWSVQDPWIDFQWNGDYEGVAAHGKSIMAYGPNSTTNAETDDFGPTGQGYGYQKGEVVDKVFYINRTSNATQIKAERILELVQHFEGHWDSAVYVVLARALGFGLNSDAFERLAMSVPLRTLLKHRDSPVALEGILFGQAGFLDSPEADPSDHYVARMKEEYRFMANKFGLTPPRSLGWRMARMRPQNFPHRRIATLAAMIAEGFRIGYGITEVTTEQEARDLFAINLTGYWSRRYNFGPPSARSVRALSDSSIAILIINVVAPVLYAHSIVSGSDTAREHAIGLLQGLKPESNHITTLFAGAGVQCRNAFDSQALIELRNNFCNTRKCLYCRIGHRFLAAKARRTQN